MLQDFHSFSGLKPNLQKSVVYYSGVSQEMKEELLHILPIGEGMFPVRYLGVPLIYCKVEGC